MVNSILHYDATKFPKAETPKELLNTPRERQVHNKSGLLLESVRLATFAFWNPVVIDAEQLARNGFYFRRTLDQVQCAFCNGSMGQFCYGDIADKDHWKFFNHKCPFIKEQPTGNVPMEGSTDALQHLYTFLQNYYMGLSEAVSINVSADPMFPHMYTGDARLNTFQNWPKNVDVNIYCLVEAGFFSVEAGDLVQCFHCGGCLLNWLPSDDPIIDHAKFYPNCKFIQSKTHTTPKTVQQPRTLTEAEADLLLLHPIAERLVAVGVQQEIVRHWLKTHLETHGVVPATVTEAMQIMPY